MKNLQPLMTHALFQHLHHRSRIAGFRFTDQKVEVLRHDHIAMDTEPVLLPRVFEYFQECLLDAVVIQQRDAPVTAARDEVQVMCTVTALQMGRHGQVECTNRKDSGSVTYYTNPRVSGCPILSHRLGKGGVMNVDSTARCPEFGCPILFPSVGKRVG